jgi:hypothetical protein
MLISPLLKLLHSIENPGTDNRGRRKTKRGEMQVELSNLRKGDVEGWASFTNFTYNTPALKRFKSLIKPCEIN